MNHIFINSLSLHSLKLLLTLLILQISIACSDANHNENEWREISLLLPSTNSSEQAGSLLYQNIRINEINARTAPYDWIELINLGDHDIDLSGCFLSDDPYLPKQAVIDAEMKLRIAAHSYLVIALSEDTFGFKLGKADHIMLSAPDGEIIDWFSYQEGQAVEGEVLARIPDGIGVMTAGQAPSPNQTNEANPSQIALDSQLDGLDTSNETSHYSESMMEVASSEQETNNSESLWDDNLPETEETRRLERQWALRINEVAAKGNPNDWVELYNPSSEAVSLQNLKIIDQLDSEPFVLDHTWGELPAFGFLVIEISDELVGFKLGSDESFYLLNPDGEIIDYIDWNEGDAGENSSFARQYDGEGEFVTVTHPTPGAPNQ